MPIPVSHLVAHRYRTPASQGACPGNISPVGITGTPVVDLGSRSLFFDAVINGNPVKHFIFSLNVDTGATNAGWPVDLDATAQFNGVNFDSFWQEERGALALVYGIVYVSYSGKSVTAAGTMDGLWAWISTILPT